ncbi:hypothetical protein [Enhygromyxa salina]|nr:hypothetical protein [Enhygromyxa salina]
MIAARRLLLLALVPLACTKDAGAEVGRDTTAATDRSGDLTGGASTDTTETDTTYTDSDSGGGCGDGVVDPREACDETGVVKWLVERDDFALPN